MGLRLRLGLTLIVLIIPFAFGTAFYQDYARERAIETTTAEQLIERMEAGERFVCEEFPETYPERRHRRRRRARPRRLMNLHAYNESFVSVNPRAPEFPSELRHALEDGEDIAARATTDLRGRPQRIIAVRMPWQGGPCAVMVVRRPGPPAGEAFERSLIPALGISFFTILLALLAAGPVVRRIRRLRRAVEDGAHPISVGGRDEVTALADAFTERQREIRDRIAEVEARDETLRRYVANTTHDVMIPLTVIQGHLSQLRTTLQAGEAADPERVRAAIEECHYLSLLMANLSVVAKLEAGEPHFETHPVNLGELVGRVVARHRPFATQREVELNQAVPSEPVTVDGDVTLLEQAVGNLLQNAIRYNQPNGHVAVVLDRERDGFVLRVLDDGPGIAEEEREKIVQRGFRSDAARTRHPHGLGLGLAIVREVADRHRLELRLQDNEPRGLVVSLRPADPDSWQE
ncbi:MAG: HAMP domain-containing sensor histidine kinase [Myxococcota bacterium]